MARSRAPSRPAAIALRDAGADLVPGSLDDADVLASAMAGAHGVFSVMPADLSAENEVRHGPQVADLAAAHEVAHFVYSSGASVGDVPTGVARFDAKPRIEAHIRALPLAATIVRPTILLDMLVRPGAGLDQGRGCR
ncbi:NmrA family NAD(P)-binding protein [Luteimonas sp. TWI662]|uniref:NmrA family NAD(P)-binding protein n=1 Tax=Luteimonas sp. TWI662 TaxID=3136789 RepID=UPI00320A6C70